MFKAALLAGVKYAEGRKAVEFESTDSANDKALYIYRLLVHDKVISPMPEDQVSGKTVRHRLAAWYAHQLPQDIRCWNNHRTKSRNARLCLMPHCTVRSLRQDSTTAERT